MSLTDLRVSKLPPSDEAARAVAEDDAFANQILNGKVSKLPQTVVSKSINGQTAAALPANNGLYPDVDPSLTAVAASYIPIDLRHRDFTMRLFALDIDIAEGQIALMLPASMHVEDMRLKAKFTLVHDGREYGVMFIGGNFSFRRAVPVLRVLSFVRIAGNV